jgi:hypothetical protein
MYPNAVQAQTEALRAMSVEQKLRVAESLRAFAWNVTRTAMRRRHPDASESELLALVRAAFSDDGA